MKYVRHVACAVALASLVVVSTGGCGGGGGGSGGGGSGSQASLLSEPYCLISFSGRDGPTDEGAAAWGEFTFDGVGTLTAGPVTTNENGVLTGPSASVTFAYTISAGAR